jgi:hypothetical protein
MKTGPKPRGLLPRFEEKYIPEPNSGCWIWTGWVNRAGYGYININGRHERDTEAHRAAWLLFRGPIPEGMYVCHKCDIPSCVNPDHLFLGTQTDNMRDASAKGRLLTGDARREAQRGKMASGENHYVNRVGRARKPDGTFA